MKLWLSTKILGCSLFLICWYIWLWFCIIPYLNKSTRNGKFWYSLSGCIKFPFHRHCQVIWGGVGKYHPICINLFMFWAKLWELWSYLRLPIIRYEVPEGDYISSKYIPDLSLRGMDVNPCLLIMSKAMIFSHKYELRDQNKMPYFIFISIFTLSCHIRRQSL